jgi:hypothetical protein
VFEIMYFNAIFLRIVVTDDTQTEDQVDIDNLSYADASLLDRHELHGEYFHEKSACILH